MGLTRVFGAAALAGLAAVSLAAPAFADDDDAGAASGATSRRASFTIVMENDKFNGTDKWYTSGVKLIFTKPAPAPDFVFAPLVSANRWAFGEAGRSRWELALGQNIYEPSDESLNPPDPKDRPYAGWLYLSALAVIENRYAQSSLEVQAGVVGPAALGEQIQDITHNLIGSNKSQGWDSQLSDEPGLLIGLSRRWRTPPLGLTRSIGIDLVPHVNVAVGNVQTYAGAGALLRLGNKLDADFGLPRVRPAGSAPVPVIRRGSGWYVFTGFEGWASARDIFLDGNTFEDSPSVDKKPLVAEFNVGFVVYAVGMRFNATYVKRSEEFDAQPQAFEYGSAALTFNF